MVGKLTKIKLGHTHIGIKINIEYPSSETTRRQVKSDNEEKSHRGEKHLGEGEEYKNK